MFDILQSLALQFDLFRKTCRNCFCKREDHDIGTAAEKDVTQRRGLNGRMAFHTFYRRDYSPAQHRQSADSALRRTGKKWVRPPPDFESTKPATASIREKSGKNTPPVAASPAVATEAASPAVATEAAVDEDNLPPPPPVEEDLPPPPTDDLPPPMPEDDLPPPIPADDNFGMDEALDDILQAVEDFGKAKKEKSTALEPTPSEPAPAAEDLPTHGEPTVGEKAEVSSVRENYIWVPEGLSDDQVGAFDVVLALQYSSAPQYVTIIMVDTATIDYLKSDALSDFHKQGTPRNTTCLSVFVAGLFQVEKFMSSLDEEFRPTNTPEGVSNHTRWQAKQLPAHDADASECNPMDAADKAELAEFSQQQNAQKSVGGVRSTDDIKVCPCVRFSN